MATTEKYQQAGPKPHPTAVKQEMVFVWPYLVSIEAIQATVLTFALSLMSFFVNAPLLGLANPERTPNPSKAPWYFLNMQELLLHMHPALAGVIAPGVVLLLLGMIPYYDRDRRGTGIWFSTRRGLAITNFSVIYTAVWEIALIMIDFYLRPTRDLKGIHQYFTTILNFPPWFGQVLLPTFLMIFIPWSLVGILRRRYPSMNQREVMIALYSFFVSSFIVLTVTGTAFRGHSMDLVWPWELKVPE